MNNLERRIEKLEASEKISDIYIYLNCSDGRPGILTIVPPAGGNHTFTDKQSFTEYAKQHRLTTNEIVAIAEKLNWY